MSARLQAVLIRRSCPRADDRPFIDLGGPRPDRVHPNLLSCDDKQARKLHQYLAIDPLVVMPIDLDSVSGKEVIDHLRLKRREKGLQRGALEPFDDGFWAGQHLAVDRVPDVHVSADRLKEIVVSFGFRYIATRRFCHSWIACPRTAVRYLPQENERRYLANIRNLQGKHSTSR